METEYRIDKNHNNNNVVSNGSTVVNFNVISEHLTTNNTSIVSDAETITVENPVPETITSINDAIKDIFIQNVTSRNSMNFNKRNYSTRINKHHLPRF